MGSLESSMRAERRSKMEMPRGPMPTIAIAGVDIPPIVPHSGPFRIIGPGSKNKIDQKVYQWIYELLFCQVMK